MRKLSIRVYARNFVAKFKLLNSKPVSFFIKYDDELVIKGSDELLKINDHLYKNRGLLERISLHKVSKNEIKKMLFELLAYIRKIVRGKDRELIKKVEKEARKKKLKVKVYQEGRKRVNRKAIAFVLIIALIFFASFHLLFPTLAMSFTKMPKVSQTTTGVLYNNGTALITLYSTGNVDIVAASLLNATVYESAIENHNLKPGNNSIVINFGHVQIMPSVLYSVSLYLSNGEIIEVTVYSL